MEYYWERQPIEESLWAAGFALYKGDPGNRTTPRGYIGMYIPESENFHFGDDMEKGVRIIPSHSITQTLCDIEKAIAEGRCHPAMAKELSF